MDSHQNCYNWRQKLCLVGIDNRFFWGKVFQIWRQFILTFSFHTYLFLSIHPNQTQKTLNSCSPSPSGTTHHHFSPHRSPLIFHHRSLSIFHHRTPPPPLLASQLLALHCFDIEDRDSYWKMMQKYIGSDVTSMVTLPVIIFEPMSTLQKMVELMEYSYLMDLADECEDPYMRLVYSSSFFITIYYACRRTWKPFNPILGETYEMVNHGGVKFIAEQVSLTTFSTGYIFLIFFV
ncbi:uncharacterized protein LOC114284536 [Camellia sinensis]|uniref:uncharacterized protein LOC114284536 n=1 Tax=Camellia sinensis TaxID=4442 RepID=UPI0010362FA1|nr:uncharacterized protein LOC114284536 [Camellia sinensis]